MGTYPELPSYVLESGEDLQKVIDKHQDVLLGQKTKQRFGHTNIPYLPKVLSIAKALPLQLHPVGYKYAPDVIDTKAPQNKKLAAELHRRDPDQFTDPNHKPEIALALSDFEAFCGFKPLADVERLMQLPPLQGFLPEVKKPTFDDQTLKHVVKTMLEASEEVIEKTNDALLQIPVEQFGKDSHIPKLIPRLSEQYDKTDNGTVVALITMNYLQLKKGDSIYIPADGIHAYLSGDIIECMARSNNVLNTGFCPKAERSSIDLFTSCLTFTPHSIEESMLRPQKYDGSKNDKTQIYAPPLSEFNVLSTQLGEGEEETIRAIDGPSMFIVTKGDGLLNADDKEHKLSEGYIFFVAHGVEMNFKATKGLELYNFYTS